ncbi:hypothetical protein SAMN04487833_13821 [Sarcina sp. DSM 11001]|nr:hypothetical protein SAMN04487833_13821 [Sarcina sp. DSM 11001]
MFDTIINISAYKVLHRLLQNQPDQMFRLTDQELDDIIKYDILNIMASYRNMMSPSQKKYVAELLESEMGFVNISSVFDDLSDSMKDEIYIPYLLKLINRINVHPVVTAAYQVLFKYCTNLIKPHMHSGLYVYDYLALMNTAYFSVIADGLGVPEYFSRYMKESYGPCNYDEFVDYIFEKNSGDIDWDLEIDLDGIDKFLEENGNTNIFKKTQHGDNSFTGAAEFFDIVNIVTDLRGEDITQTKIRENDKLLFSVSRKTGIHNIKRTIISGFDCCFCESDDYSEEYIIIQRYSSYYRKFIYDNNSLERFLEEISSTVIELDMSIWPVHIIFIKDETEPTFPEEALRSESQTFPRYIFSKEEAIAFIQDKDQRYIEGDDGYRLYIVDNRWILNDTLYVPYLKIATVKYGLENDSNINIKVVFYESKNKKLWAEYSDSDTDPDRWKTLGLIRISNFYSNQGYENKPSLPSLPHIYAEIYVNDGFYGQVSINCSYKQIQKETMLLKTFASESFGHYVGKTQKPFFPIVTAKYWEKPNDLYVPYLKIDVINQKREPAELIYVEAVYYSMKARNLWSYSFSPLVSDKNTPLKQGYRKTAFLMASVGYENQVAKDNLPDITAEIFINGDFYGTTTIDCSYDYNKYDLPLNEEPVTIDNDYVKVNNKDFYPVVKQNRWKKNSDIYAPFLQFDVINQQEEPADHLDLDVHFYNTDESESWGHYTNSTLLANVYLRPGFNISAFASCPIGYNNMLEAEALPNLEALVFINSVYYGSVKINRAYENISTNETLTMDEKDNDRQSNEGNVWNEKSFLGNMGYSTRKLENERHEILYKAVREYGKQRIVDHISFLVNMRIAQQNGAEKYKKAIKIWKEDLVYVRNV